MATTRIVLKPILMLIKKIVTKILVFGKLFRTTVVSMAYQLKFSSLVTMATNKIVYKWFLMNNKEGGDKNIGFWKII